MNYTEYMMMFSYKNEEERLNQKVNERYKANQNTPNERPQRHRRPRFWWHLQAYNDTQTEQDKKEAERKLWHQKLWIRNSNSRQSK